MYLARCDSTNLNSLFQWSAPIDPNMVVSAVSSEEFTSHQDEQGLQIVSSESTSPTSFNDDLDEDEVNK